MKYVAIDLETTGLDPSNDQILHVAAVIEDTALLTDLPEIEDLATFESVLWHPQIKGHPVALGMNAELIKTLGQVKPADAQNWTTYKGRRVQVEYNVGELVKSLCQFLRQHCSPTPPWVVAGKNAGGFDVPFLERAAGVKIFHHRVIDPGSVALGAHLGLWEESVPPSMERLGERPAHDALQDARDVVKTIRKFTYGARL